MERKGVSYDVGRVMGFNWRPVFDPKIVHRELEIIKDDLHCNAVRICGRDIERATACAQAAMEQGLEVWLSPELWDKSPPATLEYITKAASAAETLRKHWPERIVFSIGSELTLFIQGIVEGRNFTARLSNPSLIPRVKAGEHNKPLNDFLTKANAAVRSVFHGKVTYASLVWEAVDWNLFDYVGVDHYRTTKIEDKYVGMLKPSFSHGKPVVITEFGYATTHGGIGEEGFLGSSGLGGNIIDLKSQFLHYKVPVLGQFVRPHLNGDHVRDEAWQAHKLIETLGILDSAGVDGAFVFQFISQITPYSDDPHYDLDMASSSLVKYYEHGRHGTTYPDMTWEPKESFRAVADYYANH
ncbi:MAG: abortive infection protein [Nitrososphaeria archaeon]|jgi:hypothetical protein